MNNSMFLQTIYNYISKHSPELFLAIVTSLISSIIFFLVFNYIPEKIKYNKIRPRIEVELYELTSLLFHYLEISTQHNLHSPSFFQQEINDGSLTPDDFSIFLYNKCLNESYLYDVNKDFFLVVGNLLKEQANNISKMIHQIFLNQNYLTPKEYLILEEIDRLLFVYSFDDSADIRIGNNIYHPANPSIHYMGNNFYRIMKKNCELKECLFSSKLLCHDLSHGLDFYPALKAQQVHILVNKRKYKKAKKIILKLLNKDYKENVKNHLIHTLLYLSIVSKDIISAKIILRVIMLNPNRLKLLYLRTLYEWVNSIPELEVFLRNLCPKTEVDECCRALKNEKEIHNSFIRQNTWLKYYYEKKLNMSQKK